MIPGQSRRPRAINAMTARVCSGGTNGSPPAAPLPVKRPDVWRRRDGTTRRRL